MASKLDAELVRKLLALQGMSPGELSSGGDARTWAGPDGYSVTVAPGEGQWIGGDAGYYQPGAMRTLIGGNFDNATFGNEYNDVWDAQGNYLGASTGDSPLLSLAKAAALAAGGYYGASALTGAGAAGGAGGLTGVDAAMADLAASGGLTPASMGGAASAAELGANGAFLGEGVASGVPSWDAAAIKSAIGSGELGTAASYAGQTLSGGTGLETLGKVLSPAATTATNVAKGAAGSGSGLGGLLGAAAGALSSKDQTQTTNREPWSASQPFLKELLGQGSQLNAKYAQQPFSQAQQTAYGNMGSLLDTINRNAGGLLGAFNANASGANQFVRGQPQRLQGGGVNMSGFNPGLLGYMGSR